MKCNNCDAFMVTVTRGNHLTSHVVTICPKGCGILADMPARDDEGRIIDPGALANIDRLTALLADKKSQLEAVNHWLDERTKQRDEALADVATLTRWNDEKNHLLAETRARLDSAIVDNVRLQQEISVVKWERDEQRRVIQESIARGIEIGVADAIAQNVKLQGELAVVVEQRDGDHALKHALKQLGEVFDERDEARKACQKQAAEIARLNLVLTKETDRAMKAEGENYAALWRAIKAEERVRVLETYGDGWKSIAITKRDRVRVLETAARKYRRENGFDHDEDEKGNCLGDCNACEFNRVIDAALTPAPTHPAADCGRIEDCKVHGAPALPPPHPTDCATADDKREHEERFAVTVEMMNAPAETPAPIDPDELSAAVLKAGGKVTYAPGDSPAPTCDCRCNTCITAGHHPPCPKDDPDYVAPAPTRNASTPEAQIGRRDAHSHGYPFTARDASVDASGCERCRLWPILSNQRDQLQADLDKAVASNAIMAQQLAEAKADAADWKDREAEARRSEVAFCAERDAEASAHVATTAKLGIALAALDEADVALVFAEFIAPGGDPVLLFEHHNANLVLRLECLGRARRTIAMVLADAESKGQAWRVLADVQTERARQDAQWGGADHDDEHHAVDWLIYIDKQFGGAQAAMVGTEYRAHMIKIAALAVAAVESHDRMIARYDARRGGGR